MVRLEMTAAIDKELALPPDAVRALSFWGHRPGAILTIVDVCGSLFRARLLDGHRVVPFQLMDGSARPAVPLTLYQALPEKERFELVLQKSVEMGVQRIVPFISARSTTPEERDAGQRKSHRWPHVVQRAAKQCRRPDIPGLGPVMTFGEVLAEAKRWDLAVMLYEGKTVLALRDALLRTDISGAALIVGPEGGFSREETRLASEAGILPVSLGAKILRTETAAIAGVALMQFVFGELG